ncbi:MAG: ATP-binding cassette domain-containing protein [Oscillospiraceae bacterium]|nr:ATP-binding cassette domain-containing protein [Oscillospiraceae bacterium]
MILQVDNLTKRFGEKTAVDHLSFTMDRPGVFGLIGTNGAGKTTAIRMMLQMIPANEGTATWGGAPITRQTLRFGYMPEERGIYLKTKVLEQLVYFGQLRGLKKAQALQAAKDYMKRLGMSEYENTIAEKLSKGNQQKIQLIATLLHDPQLVILDEPFSGLDPINAQMLRELILELEDQGKFIIMSSHQMATVEEYCKSLVMLHHGKTILQGDLHKIKDGYGYTSLRIAGPESAIAMAERFGLQYREKTPSASVFTLPENGAAQAEAYLRAILAQDMMPTTFVMEQPTLHEIFIEKVGAQEGRAAQ